MTKTRVTFVRYRLDYRLILKHRFAFIDSLSYLMVLLKRYKTNITYSKYTKNRHTVSWKKVDSSSIYCKGNHKEFFPDREWQYGDWCVECHVYYAAYFWKKLIYICAERVTWVLQIHWKRIVWRLGLSCAVRPLFRSSLQNSCDNWVGRKCAAQDEQDTVCSQTQM